MTRIARVFPRRTNASPTDELTFFDVPGMFPIEADEVHISVAFTYDIARAERLAKAWERVAPVTMGGPALGAPGGNFTPGMYLRSGYVITSRGCPNNCWFCSVPKREGTLRELPIVEGNNVLDDNLLACSEAHVRAVFAMLHQQKMGRPEFTGGLEAARLRDWHIDLLSILKPKQVFFAYDTPDDWEPLVIAAKKMRKAGFTPQSKRLRAYCLIGFPGDTMDAANKRLRATLALGVLPMAMLWRNKDKPLDRDWMRFRSPWMRAAIMRMEGFIHDA